MADEVKDDGNIVAKAKAALNKAARESVEAKVKGLFAKRVENEKAIKQIDTEVEQIIADYQAGLL